MYQAANSVALFVGFSLSAQSLARVGVVRALQIGMLGMLIASAYSWGSGRPGSSSSWSRCRASSSRSGVTRRFVANQLLIDHFVGDDAYTFIVVRELALGAGRTLAPLVAIGATVAVGDGAARPLMAAYMLAPVGAAYCLARALGETG